MYQQAWHPIQYAVHMAVIYIKGMKVFVERLVHTYVVQSMYINEEKKTWGTIFKTGDQSTHFSYWLTLVLKQKK